MRRMEMVTIDIPPTRGSPAHDAAGIVIATLRSLGIDPRKALDVPMIGALTQQWSRGEINDADFKHCCEMILIMNPTLAVK